jgi:hypothetical protein
VCRAEFYGAECSTPCGQCKTGDVCNNVTGVCPNGCQEHWNESRCDGKTLKYADALTILATSLVKQTHLL